MNQPLNLQEIDCIIFDLGKVLINLEVENTSRAFQNIFQSKYESIFIQLSQEGFFEAYETGKMTSDEFLNRLQAEAPEGTSIDSIRQAWNAMLLDFPHTRFELLLWAKEHFHSLCLSNTNEIHIAFIENLLRKEKGHGSLSPYFNQVYYSHEMGLRKPEPEIFQVLIDEHKLNPTRTLFIDDTAGHLIGAEKTGLKTRHFLPGERIENLFSDF